MDLLTSNSTNISSVHNLLQINHICWYVTERCNYNCQFCYRYHEQTEISSKEDAYQIIDKLIELGITRLTFTGEPLLMPWIFDALAYSKSQGLYTTLMTNGSLLTERVIKELPKFIDRISLPLDGSSNEMNIKMTRPDGHFERVKKISQMIDYKNILLKISTVATAINWRDIPLMPKILEGMNVCEWKLYQFRSNRGNALLNSGDYSIKDKYFERTIEKINNSLTDSSISFSSISLRDRFSDYSLIRPDGVLELATGSSYIKLGKLLDFSTSQLKGNTQKLIEALPVNKSDSLFERQ